MSDEWFVHSDNQQLGPYSGEQLVEFAQQGNIVAETLVWTEGMDEWAPASQIPGLFANPAPVVQQAIAVPTTSAAWNPNANRGIASRSNVAPTKSNLAAAPMGGDYPYFKVKPASFGLWLGMFLGGFVMIIVAMIAVSTAANEANQGATVGKEIAIISLVLLGIAVLTMMFSTLLFYICLYRAWFCLQPGGASTTPGKAIGFLFIPFFNIYWIFVAFSSLPKDWNRIVSSHPNLSAAPRLNETIFLFFCIGVIIIPPIAMITTFPIMSQLCKGINFFATRRDPSATSSIFSRPSFGGIR